MSGVSSDVDQKTQEVFAIMDGGHNFVARMTALQDGRKALEEARAAHDKSLAELRLGEEARQALDRAHEVLAAARTQAEQILTNARATADQMTNDARAISAAAERYVADQRRESDTRVQAADLDASGRLAVAKQEHTAAAALRVAAEKLKDEAAKVKAELQSKQGLVDAEREVLRKKLATLREALSKVG